MYLDPLREVQGMIAFSVCPHINTKKLLCCVDHCLLIPSFRSCLSSCYKVCKGSCESRAWESAWASFRSSSGFYAQICASSQGNGRGHVTWRKPMNVWRNLTAVLPRDFAFCAVSQSCSSLKMKRSRRLKKTDDCAVGPLSGAPSR